MFEKSELINCYLTRSKFCTYAENPKREIIYSMCIKTIYLNVKKLSLKFSFLLKKKLKSLISHNDNKEV